MKPIVRALAGSVLITAFLAGPALAQDYPPEQPTAGVTDSVVVACGTTTVTGTNWEAGSTVQILFDGEVIATATVGADGTFSTTVTIPCDAAPGTHVLGITGFNQAGQARVVNTTITIVAGAGGGVPGTGADVSAGIAVMAGLFALGIVAIVVTRRRRAATPA
ncbi:MAG TPA: hypothetical protein VFQ40_06640 [Actinomycetota bacterium]|nr:hypothetical protein [Actinomycetota bacterium]